MLRWLSKVRGKPTAAARGAQTVAILEHGPFNGPIYVVGDVHGCFALYRALEKAILKDAGTLGENPTIILLGDVVDRGPDTAGLLDHLIAPTAPGVTRICLRGNHEDMMLQFLSAPTINSPWLEFGGFETLMSYGLALDLDTSPSSRRLMQMLQAHIPQAHCDFLEQLPFGLHAGRYALVHAAIDPAAPLDCQPRQTVLWGDPEGLSVDGLTIVHGHIIVSEAIVGKDRIALDTGAYQRGTLTAARLHPHLPPIILQSHT